MGLSPPKVNELLFLEKFLVLVELLILILEFLNLQVLLNIVLVEELERFSAATGRFVPLVDVARVKVVVFDEMALKSLRLWSLDRFHRAETLYTGGVNVW